MPLPELLGYINEYVEHQHLPCIMIADEKVWKEACSIKRNSALIHKHKADKKELWLEAEFSADNISLHELESVKEKVIGKTFQINTDPIIVLNQWIAPGTIHLSDRTRKTLQGRCEILHKVFLCAPAQNFRAFKHALMDFQRFIGSDPEPVLEDRHLYNKEFMDRLIVDFMCIQYWAHLGILSAGDIGKTTVVERIYAQRQTWSKTTELAPWERVTDRIGTIDGLYGKVYNYNRIDWENLWKVWLSKNWIAPATIRNLINDSIWFDRHNDYWAQKYFQWFQLTDEEGTKAKAALDTALENFTITHPAMILRYFDSMLWYANKGALEVTPDQVVEKFTKYVDDLGDRLDAGNIDDETGIHELSCKNESQEIQFKQYLQQKLAPVMEKAKMSWSKDLIQLIETNPSEAANQITRLNAYDDQKSFEGANVSTILNAFGMLDNQTDILIWDALATRYSMVDSCKWLMKERRFLEELKAECEKRYTEHAKPLPPSIFSLFYLNQRIDKGLKKLNEAQKRVDEEMQVNGDTDV
jgi:hypothetical protein